MSKLLQRNFILQILYLLLLQRQFDCVLGTTTKSLETVNIATTNTGKLEEDGGDSNDFKVSNELFFGVEEKPSPVVAIRNLILMMVKAAPISTAFSVPTLVDDEDVSLDEEDQDEEEETVAFHESPQELEMKPKLRATWRRDRFYYCGPKDKKNSCPSLCYAFGYPRITCGRISCYCTW